MNGFHYTSKMGLLSMCIIKEKCQVYGEHNFSCHFLVHIFNPKLFFQRSITIKNNNNVNLAIISVKPLINVY